MEDNNGLVLIIDDDINVLQIMKMYLVRDSFDVATCERGDTALSVFNKLRAKIVLLDIMLPGKNAYEVLNDIRKASSVPVIMLTAKGEIDDRVEGLDLGADDYVSKPGDANELVARVKAVIRRAYSDHEEKVDNTKAVGNLTVSLEKYEVTLDGELIKMPPKELELLFFLASNGGKVYTREQLLKSVWGFDFFGDTRTVDVHIKRIREKLTNRQGWDIVTCHTVGYMFTEKKD